MTSIEDFIKPFEINDPEGTSLISQVKMESIFFGVMYDMEGFDDYLKRQVSKLLTHIKRSYDVTAFRIVPQVRKVSQRFAKGIIMNVQGTYVDVSIVDRDGDYGINVTIFFEGSRVDRNVEKIKKELKSELNRAIDGFK